MKQRHQRSPLWASLAVTGLAMLLLTMATAVAIAQGSPLHPTFPLLDANGTHVLESGAPVSTMQTCGNCHHTEFIASHSYHTAVGLDELAQPGTLPGTLPWETGTGAYGGWDPLTYRYLTPDGTTTPDLGTADWVTIFGERHVGGGPAVVGRHGTPLTDLRFDADDPQTYTVDPATGTVTAWDWNESGVVEMNCFLCHLAEPNYDARAESLAAGDFGWANSATLVDTGIVTQTADGLAWQPDAFGPDGDLIASLVTIQDPTADQCGACHGTVYLDSAPMLPEELTTSGWNTQRTGQVFSDQRLKDTGLNLADKVDLTRAWDVHAERNLECSNCHFSPNNPIYYEEDAETRPDHLNFDPRRLDLGDYLLRPDHNFAHGGDVTTETAETMRSCESCHNAESTHDWLPYTTVHLDALSCETCHIPRLYAPAVAQNDWTVITPDVKANVTYRGVDGPVDDVRSLVTGFEPVLLETTDPTGRVQLKPYNLITSYYWVVGDPARPVLQADLEQVYLDGTEYAAEILTLFDENGDSLLDNEELRLDTDAKVDLVRRRLSALGLENPRIEGTVEPYAVNHNVATGTFATRDCKTCHNETSRLSQPFTLTAYLPGGVQPQFVMANDIKVTGNLEDAGGALKYVPATAAMGYYLPGHNRVDWIGFLGLAALLATLAGVLLHGGLRLYQARRLAHDSPEHSEVRRVYMYSMYERAWHWLQAITILLLMATGIVIHRPDTLGSLDLGLMVPVHNALAAILVANAVFSAFYHFASGEIRQYLPEPHGYFRQALTQVDFYMRGIFKGEPHPFQKSPYHKLNPLQQATYLVILNILLPLQILTGLAMWALPHWPGLISRLGGLPWLAPAHTLVAWLFASFVVLHIYLTTTGHTPLENIKAMTVGWEEVETEPAAQPDTPAQPA